MTRLRLRLLPVAIAASLLLVLVKAERIAAALWGSVTEVAMAPPAAPAAPASMRTLLAARAEAQPAPQRTPSPAPQPAQPASLPPPPAPPPAEAAERAVLEALRGRRAELEAREQAAAQREVMLAAAERRLTQRVEELTQLQTRLEALERDRAAREDAGLRGLVKVYEGMRPRDAAQIFDELDMPVLLSIVDRMREAKAAPVLSAMRPDRARVLTSELARLRGERLDQERAAAPRPERP